MHTSNNKELSKKIDRIHPIHIPFLSYLDVRAKFFITFEK